MPDCFLFILNKFSLKKMIKILEYSIPYTGMLLNKRIFSAAVVTIILLLITIVWMLFFKKDKIAYVESSRLLTGYKAMADVRKEFDGKSKQWQANIDTLTQDIQQSIFKYEKETSKGSEEDKKKAKEAIGIKQKQLNDYQRATQQNAQQEEARLTTPILTEVNAFLMEYGKSHGYKMIFVANNGNIAYADKGLDLTDEIVELLNKSYKMPIK